MQTLICIRWNDTVSNKINFTDMCVCTHAQTQMCMDSDNCKI